MKSSLTLGAACALLATSASAAVLVDYKMTAPAAALNSAFYIGHTALHANIGATPLANHQNAGNTGSEVLEAGTDRVTTWNSTAGSGATTDVTYANAFTAGNYVTFTITADAGYQITFDSISFQAGIASSNSAARRGVFLVTETSAEAFSDSSTVLTGDVTGAAAVGGTLVYYASPTNSTAPLTYNASLSGLSVLGEGQTQIFRLYFQTQDANQGIFLDDIVINGTVSAVPEPSAFALLAGAAVLGAVALRRRR